MKSLKYVRVIVFACDGDLRVNLGCVCDRDVFGNKTTVNLYNKNSKQDVVCFYGVTVASGLMVAAPK